MPAPHLVALILGLAAVAAGAEPADAPAKADLYGDPLPPGAVARLGTVRFRKPYARCYAVAFSPDGKTLAALGAVGQISLWDVRSGRLLYEEEGPREEKEARSVPLRAVLAFAPDGKSLVAGLTPRPPRVWDVEARKEIRRLEGNDEVAAAVSADGKTVAVVGTDGTITILDVASGKKRQDWKADGAALPPVALSPDGKRVAVAEKDGVIRLWDAATGEKVAVLEGFGGTLTALAFSPDGATVAAGWQNGLVGRWRLADDDWYRWDASGQGTKGLVRGLAFSPDGKTLAVSFSSSALDLWNVFPAKRLRALPGPCGPSCVFSPDGRTLASGHAGGIEVWDAAAGRLLRPGPHGVRSLAFAADGKALLTVEGPRVRRWEPAVGKFLGEAEMTAVPARFTNDGDRVYEKADVFRLADLATAGNLPAPADLEVRPGDIGGVRPLALSPDGAKAAVTYPDLDGWALLLLDRMAGKEAHPLGNFVGPAAVAFSPDGRTFAAVGPLLPPALADRDEDPREFKARLRKEQWVCRLWDVATGRPRREFSVERPLPEALLFSPDTRYLTAPGADGSVRVWETATGKKVLDWSPAGEPARALALSPDGRTWATAGAKKRLDEPSVVRLWDVDSREELRSFTAPELAGVERLAFSPDGTRLASASAEDETALIWDVNDLVKRERSPAVRLTAKEAAGLWPDLGGADAAKAYRAGRALARAPEEAPPLFAARLPEWLNPPGPEEAKRLAAVVARLGSESFAEREKASDDLDQFGAPAVRSLRGRLRGDDLSLEARLRIQQWLVRKGEDAADEAAERQWSRATEVLERLGTPEARKLLEKLAAADGPAADQAKASLERLNSRPAAP